MELMPWFHKKKNAYNSETLRELLFTALRQGDVDRFNDLCNEHASLIIQYFSDWTNIRGVPHRVRQDPDAVQIWGDFLLTIADVFKSLGHPELLAYITRETNDNPITRWTRGFGKADYLYETGKYEQSNSILFEILKELEGTMGSAVDDLRPKTYGKLGTNFFRLNDLNRARKYTELALSGCELTGDKEGITIYKKNLAVLLGASNPNSSVVQCRKQVVKAQDFSDHLQYEYSNKLLEMVLIDIELNPELRCYRSKVYGLMGSNNFRLGDLQHARRRTELAIRDCESDGDDTGIRIYKENLQIISKKEVGVNTLTQSNS
jgi:tetratricopeptide (TPR) repeat protein